MHKGSSNYYFFSIFIISSSCPGKCSAVNASKVQEAVPAVFSPLPSTEATPEHVETLVL